MASYMVFKSRDEVLEVEQDEAQGLRQLPITVRAGEASVEDHLAASKYATFQPCSPRFRGVFGACRVLSALDLGAGLAEDGAENDRS